MIAIAALCVVRTLLAYPYPARFPQSVTVVGSSVNFGLENCLHVLRALGVLSSRSNMLPDITGLLLQPFYRCRVYVCVLVCRWCRPLLPSTHQSAFGSHHTEPRVLPAIGDSGRTGHHPRLRNPE